MEIELLYIDGCPHYKRLLDQLPGLLKCAGVAALVVSVCVETDEDAQRERFLGSPTIRVNGCDVDSGAVHRSDYGLKCPIYHTPSGPSGLPCDTWLLQSLTEGRQEGF
jgi:hypothetical protein